MPISAAIVGGIGAVGSIGSAVIGSNAAQSAAQTQAQAAEQAQQTQLQMFNTAQAAEAPYNQVGQGATQTLAGLYGINGSGAGTGTPSAQSLNAFTQSPDYQFALQQGTQAMQRSAAAGGTLISGGQLKAGQEFGQGLASQQYGNYYNRLLSLSQLGQSAASGISNSAIQSGAQIGNSIQAGGQATASGIVGSANAISGGLTGATGGVASAALLSKLGGGSSGSLSSYTPQQIGSIGNMDASLATDSQANAYGVAMGL
jgi:hypothetical protein